MTLQVTGDITYNGKGFGQFKAVHTSSYVDQNDLHQPLLTVRETLDFAARCQGVGHKVGELLLPLSLDLLLCWAQNWWDLVAVKSRPASLLGAPLMVV